ncbi:MAG: tRNA (adenosine(37)-N6)-threonylcarbamoyltransferase complex ATPase subunit type 1 TsaE [Planctomycetota bacterium]|nr:tRNA (adenosine(37)-N6)-threonylcarbamoyltransferase complex ATPase subunit type 1 TsaE [Planctomycetota bacterium]
MQALQITVPDTEAMLALGASVAAAIEASGCTALLIELRGDLGAGKTVFVRGLARRLGVPSEVPVVSPTFTIARSYPASCGAIRELHHVDAYRLSGAEELDAAGFEEMCGEGRLTCVEWGEYVREALPEDRVRVSLVTHTPEDLEPGAAPECPRSVTLEALGPSSAALLDVLRPTLETSA